MIPTHQRQLDSLQALTIPAGDQARVESFLAAGQDYIDRMGNDPDDYFEQRFTPEFRAAAKAARSYGLKACTG